MSVDVIAGQIYFDRDPIKNFADLITRYGENEFKSPLRSTIPLLSLIKDGRFLLNKVLAGCGFPEESNLHFEFTVDSPLGVGIPSHTDMMVCHKGHKLAIECKWAEPRYETVRKWIKKPPDFRKDGKPRDPDNRRKRLEGWLELLQHHTSCKLHIEAFPETIYQMVHRAASACAESEHPQLVYLLFNPLPNGKSVHSKQYENDLKHLHHALGSPSGFPFHLIEVDIAPTKAFLEIAQLPKASSETAKIVKDALLDSSLFDFSTFRQTAIVTRT